MSMQVTVTLGADGPVAVKTATTDDDIERLRSEAEHLRRAVHPGVVALVGSGPVGAGHELRTRYVGDPLQRWRGTVAQVAGVCASVAATLADLHEVGIVHGRLDESHVLVAEDGRPRLCGVSGMAGAETADDVAAVGRLIEALLARATAERRTLPWPSNGPAGDRRALTRVAARLRDPVRGRRLSARRLSGAILAAVPGAALPGPTGQSGPPLQAAPLAAFPAHDGAQQVLDHDDPPPGHGHPAPDDEQGNGDLSHGDAGDDDPGDESLGDGRLLFDSEGETPEAWEAWTGWLESLRSDAIPARGPATGPVPLPRLGDPPGHRPSGDTPSNAAPDARRGGRRSRGDRARGPDAGRSPGRALDSGTGDSGTGDSGAQDGNGESSARDGSTQEGRPGKGGGQAGGARDSSAGTGGGQDGGEQDDDDRGRGGGDGSGVRRPAPGGRLRGDRGAGARRRRPPTERRGPRDNARPRPAGHEGTRRAVGVATAGALGVTLVAVGLVAARPPGTSRTAEGQDRGRRQERDLGDCVAVTPPAADVDGDSCPDALTVEGRTIVAENARWSLGQAGDVVAVGDWDCDGTVSPALLRPTTGDVFLFPGWAPPGEPVTVTAAHTVPGGARLHARPGADDCDVLVVVDAEGRRTTVDEVEA